MFRISWCLTECVVVRNHSDFNLTSVFSSWPQLPSIYSTVLCVRVPVGHGLLPLNNVHCDWLSSVSRRLPADEGGVMVNLLHRGLFGSIRHLWDGKKPEFHQNCQISQVFIFMIKVFVRTYWRCLSLWSQQTAGDHWCRRCSEPWSWWCTRDPQSALVPEETEIRSYCSQFELKQLHSSEFWRSHLAASPRTGWGDGHPQVSVGVSLLNDVVGDGTATIIQRRLPGNDHVVPVNLTEHDRALWWLRTVWQGEVFIPNLSLCCLDLKSKDFISQKIKSSSSPYKILMVWIKLYRYANSLIHVIIIHHLFF